MLPFSLPTETPGVFVCVSRALGISSAPLVQRKRRLVPHFRYKAAKRAERERLNRRRQRQYSNAEDKKVEALRNLMAPTVYVGTASSRCFWFTCCWLFRGGYFIARSSLLQTLLRYALELDTRWTKRRHFAYFSALVPGPRPSAQMSPSVLSYWTGVQRSEVVSQDQKPLYSA